MIKLIIWFAAAVSLGVAAFLPYVESRRLGATFNDEFHPEEEVMVDANMDWNDDFHTTQLVCNYGPCNEERRLETPWNDDFHPSEEPCPQTIDVGQGNRHLGIKFNDDYHSLPSGVLCLIPTPDRE